MNPDDPRHLLASVVKVLNKLKIPYIVTGGIAVLIWGRPRFTADIDIVVELQPEGVNSLANSLKKISSLPYINQEDMINALKHYSEFNFIDGTTGIKVDFWILKENDKFDLSRFKRAVVFKVSGEKIKFTAPEDLMLIKLKWYKESLSDKQLEDVKSILKISEDKIDFRYLKHWAKKLGVDKILGKL